MSAERDGSIASPAGASGSLLETRTQIGFSEEKK